MSYDSTWIVPEMREYTRGDTHPIKLYSAVYNCSDAPLASHARDKFWGRDSQTTSSPSGSSVISMSIEAKYENIGFFAIFLIDMRPKRTLLYFAWLSRFFEGIWKYQKVWYGLLPVEGFFYCDIEQNIRLGIRYTGEQNAIPLSAIAEDARIVFNLYWTSPACRHDVVHPVSSFSFPSEKYVVF